MSKQVQFRRGTTAQTSTFTGAVGEVTVDTTKDVLVVHDGATAGGFPVASARDVAAANLSIGNVSASLAITNLNLAEYSSAFALANALPTTVNGLTANVAALNSNVFVTNFYANANTAAYLATAGIPISSSLITASKVTAANLVSTGNLYVSGNLFVTGTTTSVNQETINGVEIVAGNIVANSGTASTNTTTGALVVSGGIGASGDINIGGTLSATTGVVAGTVSATTIGNIGANHVGNGGFLSNVIGANVTGTVTTSNVAQYAAVATTGTDASYYLPFGVLGTTGNTALGVATSLSFNPSTGRLTATGLTTTVVGTSATSFNLVNANALTVNAFGAATAVNLGASNVNLNVGTSTGNITAGNVLSANYLFANGVNLLTTATNYTDANVAFLQAEINAANAIVAATTYTNYSVSQFLPTYTGAIGQSSSILALVSNVSVLQGNAVSQALQINSINANVSSANSAIQTLNANVGAYEIYANANIGTITNNITSINANVAAANAAILGLQTGSGFATTAQLSANVNAANSAIQLLGANVGSYETWANLTFTNYANSNVSSYLSSGTDSTIIGVLGNITAANSAIVSIQANITAANSAIQTLNANVGAYETWANLTFGTLYSNANVAGYLLTNTNDISAPNLRLSSNKTISSTSDGIGFRINNIPNAFQLYNNGSVAVGEARNRTGFTSNLMLDNSTVYGISQIGYLNSNNNTTVSGFNNQLNAANTYPSVNTVSTYVHYSSGTNPLPLGTYLDTHIGFNADPSMTVGNVNIGYYGALPAATTSFNLFMAGADSQFDSNVIINGNLTANGNVSFASTTGTPSTPGSVASWLKVKVGGSVYYMPLYQ